MTKLTSFWRTIPQAIQMTCEHASWTITGYQPVQGLTNSRCVVLSAYTSGSWRAVTGIICPFLTCIHYLISLPWLSDQHFPPHNPYKRLVTLSTYRRYTNNCIYLSIYLSIHTALCQIIFILLSYSKTTPSQTIIPHNSAYIFLYSHLCLSPIQYSISFNFTSHIHVIILIGAWHSAV